MNLPRNSAMGAAPEVEVERFEDRVGDDGRFQRRRVDRHAQAGAHRRCAAEVIGVRVGDQNGRELDPQALHMAENLLGGILVEAGVHQNGAVVLDDQPGV